MKPQPLKIEIEGTDKEFLEACLNMAHSGIDVQFPFFMFVLKRRMNIKDMKYYLKEMGIK